MSSVGSLAADRVVFAKVLEAEVGDHVVTERERLDGRGCLVAYVVPLPGADHGRLRSRLDDVLGRLAVDASAILVDCIPRGDDGSPDLAALDEVAVLDASAVGRYGSVVGAQLGAAVSTRVVPAGPRRRRVHLWDVDPESRPSVDALSRPSESVEPPGPSSTDGRSAAVSSGDMPPREEARTLPDALRRAAASSGGGVRTVSASGSEVFTSFAELLESGSRLASSLRAQGVSPGERAIVVAGELDRFFPALWGCLLADVVPLTVLAPAAAPAPGTILEKLFRAWQALGEPTIVVGMAAEADGLRAAAGRYGTGDPTFVTVEGGLADHAVAGGPRTEPRETAVLQMSSGSTGDPKLIQITHEAVHDFARTSIGLDRASGEVSLNWLPMDHVVPLVMYHLRDVVLGCTGVHVATDLVLRDPIEWLRLLERHRVNHTWSPNFGYRLVSEALERTEVVDLALDLTQMKTFVNAGEQCTLPAVEGFLRTVRRFGVAPEAFLLGWGMAETCTVTTWKRFSDEGAVHRLHAGGAGDGADICDEDGCSRKHVTLLSMGRPAAGSEIRVLGADGAVTHEDRIGRLQIRGRRVTPGYLTPTMEADRSSFDRDGWFDTGDLAFLHSGEVVITGRAKEMIVLHGANVYCHEIESAVADIDGVASGLVGSCGISHDRFGGEVLAVFFVPTTPDPLEHGPIVSRIQSALLRAVGMTADYVVPLDEERFARTTSGKVQRGLMRQRLLDGAYDDIVKRADLAAASSRTVPECAYELAWEPVSSLSARTGAEPRCVVVMDDAGLGGALSSLLPGETERVLPIVGRRGVSRGGPGGELVFDPTDPSAWTSMLDMALGASGSNLVVYLPAYGVTGPANRGACAPGTGSESIDRRCGRDLLALCRALAGRAADSIRLVVATRAARSIDLVAEDCSVASAAALLMAVSAEVAGLDGCFVDLEGRSIDADARALCDTCSSGWPGPELAWQAGVPYVRCFRSVTLDSAGAEPPFRDGAFYVVSGGLGGVGSELLAELQERWHLNLLVIGRTPLSADGGASSRRRAFERLAGGGGGSVEYQVADITDAARVEAIVEDAERRLGRSIDGALHLAGEYEGRLLADQPVSTDIEGEAVFRSKAVGARVLGEICAARPGSVFVAFTSTFGYVETLGGAHYAAANRFVDAYAAHLRLTRGVPAYSLSWGQWRGTGMAVDGAGEAWLGRRGIISLSPTEARHLAVAVLRRPPGHYIVGLDGAHSTTPARIVSDRPTNLETVSVVVPAAVLPADWTPPPLEDDFGSAVPVALAEPDEHHASDSGERNLDSDVSSANARLGEVIREIIGQVTSQRLDDDRAFYEAGLDSITILRVHNRLEEQLGIEFERGVLFEYSTVRSLAAYLAAHGVSDGLGGS
uniref:NRPS/PKS hybrid protein n=1 Tax=uncultured bacterium NM_1663 TaxID=1630017 RepID=A0A0E3M0J9_9BACT|nr:NRPS/PKS hybrid protein [uncultured bacterium NM_1663]